MKKIFALCFIGLLMLIAVYVRQTASHTQQVNASILKPAEQHEMAMPVDYREFESAPTDGVFTLPDKTDPLAPSDSIAPTSTSVSRIIVVKH